MAQEIIYSTPPHTVPAVDDYSLDVYASYADSFDLSLLSSEITLCPPQSHIVLEQHQQLQQQCHNSLLSPAHMTQPMKQEKCWNDLMQQQSTTSVLQEQLRSGPQYQYYTNGLISPHHQQSEPFITIFPPSPCPSLDMQTNINCLNSNFAEIKQEYGFLPPSPPESTNGGSPSPYLDIKIEPETESCIDIDSLLSESFDDYNTKKLLSSPTSSISSASLLSPAGSTTAAGQDYQLLREYLQDTSFQRKHNLKPLALESLFGGWTSRGDIEPVISLALEQAKRDVQETCAALDISQDPQKWTSKHVQSWLLSTLSQFKLPDIHDMENVFPEDGEALFQLSEDEFIQRSPQAGSTLHAQLEVWKAACYDVTQQMYATVTPTLTNAWSPADSHCSDASEDEDEEMPLVVAEVSNILQPSKSNEKNEVTVPTVVISGPATPAASSSTTTMPLTTSVSESAATTTTPSSTSSTGTVAKTPRQGGSHIHLWQFLKELLATPQTHGSAIRWLDRTKGVFKIEDSVRVARLWGRRKNRPAMNYDKLSRSIRQYYKKGIMKKTERSQRLVYQFCHPYCL